MDNVADSTGGNVNIRAETELLKDVNLAVEAKIVDLFKNKNQEKMTTDMEHVAEEVTGILGRDTIVYVQPLEDDTVLEMHDLKKVYDVYKQALQCRMRRLVTLPSECYQTAKWKFQFWTTIFRIKNLGSPPMDKQMLDLLKLNQNKPVNRSCMRRLKKRRYGKSIAEKRCCICMELFKSREYVSVLNCGHVFHFTCLRRWLCKYKNHTKCVLCKREIAVSTR